MGILRADRVSGLGGANAITGSVYYKRAQNLRTPNHSDYALGSNDFTIECWWNPAGDLTPTTGGAGDQNFIALWNNTLLFKLEEFINNGIRKIDMFTNNFKVSYETWEINNIDPFFNINNYADLKVAKNVLKV